MKKQLTIKELKNLISLAAKKHSEYVTKLEGATNPQSKNEYEKVVQRLDVLLAVQDAIRLNTISLKLMAE